MTKETETVKEKDPNILKEFVLPVSGKKVSIMKANGRAFLRAKILVGNKADELDFALAAEIMLFDGEKILYEDILEMAVMDTVTVALEMGKFLNGTQSE